MNNIDQTHNIDANLETPEIPFKKTWTAPKIEIIEFMDTAAQFNIFGGVDFGMYSSN